MNNLILSPHFLKAYKKYVRRFPFLKERIDESINLLEMDIYHPKLQTHKLSGGLFGSMACSCGYDCRIVFKLIKDSANKDILLLITLGTHEDIY